MSGGYKKIEPADGKQFSKDYQPKENGRKPSIKKQLLELMESEGKLKIEAKNVININDDGSIIIKLPTEMQIAMKLKQWAMSKRGTDSIKAIQMIMEQIDGKPKQESDVKVKLDVLNYTQEERDKRIQDLLKKDAE